jgi:hypothetical protein
MRYCDIDAPRSRPRTSNVTCAAYREKPDDCLTRSYVGVSLEKGI